MAYANAHTHASAHAHPDFFSNESNLIHQSQRTLANGLKKDPMEQLRLLCFSRGSTGLLELSRVFRKMDEGGNKALNAEEFIGGIHASGLHCSNEEALNMFESIDTEGSGVVLVSEILERLRPPVHQSRLDIIDKAFNKIDAAEKGIISVADLKHFYSVKVHPKYKSGEMSESEIWKEFLENFQGPFGDNNENITREEFINFYTSMSASIENDTYFDLLVRQAYNL